MAVCFCSTILLVEKEQNQSAKQKSDGRFELWILNWVVRCYNCKPPVRTIKINIGVKWQTFVSAKYFMVYFRNDFFFHHINFYKYLIVADRSSIWLHVYDYISPQVMKVQHVVS